MAREEKPKQTALEESTTWYESNRHRYEGLGRTVEGVLREVLTARKIDFLTVTSRAKSVESYRGKIERKQYHEPRSEVTDLCGVRVITYLESDVKRVCEILREAFEIDSDRSLDKSGELAVDRVGYRSVHFVCRLGSQRSSLLEYHPFADLVFEIQVRTVLQHAWAQIEHDRNYKFGGVLPAVLQRRLFLAAGLLEVADREFENLTEEIDQYDLMVRKRTSQGDLDLEITSQTLLAYFNMRREEFSFLVLRVIESDTEIQQRLIQELRDFDINTIRELDKLFSVEYLNAARTAHKHGIGDLGLTRGAMMFADLRKYFEIAWHSNWNMILGETYDLLAQKYSMAEMMEVLSGKIEAVIRDGVIEPLS